MWDLTWHAWHVEKLSNPSRLPDHQKKERKKVNKGAPDTMSVPVILGQRNQGGYKFFTTTLQTLLKPRTMQWKDWNNAA